jgi:chaperonin GroES
MSEYNCGLKPLGGNVVVELSEQEQKQGILYIPPSSDSKPVQGTLVAVGPGTKEVDTSGLVLGSRVLFKQYAGAEFEQDDKKYLVLQAADILCEVTA